MPMSLPRREHVISQLLIGARKGACTGAVIDDGVSCNGSTQRFDETDRVSIQRNYTKQIRKSIRLT